MSHPPLPPDDLSRDLTVVDPDSATVPQIGLVGDTYTILLSGKDTGGHYCLIDMHIPPGGGPPPHRHAFEESFTLLAGELEFTFRGTKKRVRAGQTVHVPANAPHQFKNAGSEAARVLCLCAPAGQDAFFQAVGTPVKGRTEPAAVDPAALAATKAKATRLAPEFRTELL